MIKTDLRGRDITDERVLEVMGSLPREQFVPAAYKTSAYADCPLPIGAGQTISQPYIVALMTQELAVKAEDVVLEIGTGSGYQAAILARLANKVYTIERIAALSKSAQQVLAKLGITNVEFYIGDGSCGWPKSRLPDKGFFDKIMITAAVPAIPQPLIEQLGHEGLIVAPVGTGSVQQLVVGQKKADKLAERVICDVRFVKLIGKYSFSQ